MRRQRGAVDRGRLDDLAVDAAKTGQEHRHHEAGRLPHPGDHDGVDRHIGVDEPVEGEARPAPVMHQLLQAEAGIENPLPGGSRDDERNRHGIQIDRAQNAFGADLLVEQNGEQQSEGCRDADIECREYREILDCDIPAGAGPQAGILLETDILVAGQHPGGAQRQIAGPDHEAIDEDHSDQESRRQYEPRQPLLKPVPCRLLSDGRRREGNGNHFHHPIKEGEGQRPCLFTHDRRTVTGRWRPPRPVVRRRRPATCSN